MRQESQGSMPNLQRMRALSAVMLVAGLGVGALLLLPAMSIFRVAGLDVSPSDSQFAVLVVSATWLVLAASSATLLFMVKGVIRWHKKNAEEQSGSSEAKAAELVKDWLATKWKLESQLQETKRVEKELQGENQGLQDQVASISRSRELLQDELDKLKRAERESGQKRQELERTKDVLELHVQARAQELQNLQRLYEGILNSAGEGICGLDLEGRITFVNPAAATISGWTVEELVGKRLQEVFQHVKPHEPLKEPEKSGMSEQILYRKDGAQFHAEYMQTPIQERGRLAGAVVVFKDITERKKAQEALTAKAAELARSNAELEQFAFVASHDLQEPLRKIQAFGDRLKSKCRSLDLGDGWDYLERMRNAAERMQRLIKDLLTFSRAIRSDQAFVPVDLNVAAKDVLNDLEVRVEQTKAVVELDPLPTIDADPTQMRQLLQNLVGNALKFQPLNAKPKVKIGGRMLNQRPQNGTEFISLKEMSFPNGSDVDNYFELTVQDNGIGFEQKYADRIFVVFQRLHGREDYEGTGVGLAVCRRIADRHSGTITARSTPGEGATFSVILPLRSIKK